MSEQECKCSLRLKLVGDGCAVCNPGYAAWLSEQESDEAIPYEITPEGRAMLEGK